GARCSVLGARCSVLGKVYSITVGRPLNPKLCFCLFLSSSFALDFFFLVPLMILVVNPAFQYRRGEP
ncbi:MAG TPA: hypothetical protein VFB20_06810, partial [Burkholderiales bacterium]|nr:hypothetical protein [Burkholderiales bacterium]